MNLYVVIKNISVYDATALQCMAVYGIPSATAWGGFFDAIRRKFSQKNIGMDFFVDGFNVSYRNCMMNTSKSAFQNVEVFNISPLLSKKISKENIAEFVLWENPKISFSCNIILKLDIQGYQSSRKSDFVKTLYDSIYDCRPCGGKYKYSSQTRIKVCETEEQIKMIPFDLMLGSILVDRTNILKQYHQESNESDMLYSLMDFLTVLKDEDGKLKKKTDEGYFVPYTVGFRKFDYANFKLPNFITENIIVSESVLTLSEVVLPTKFQNNIDAMLWKTKSTNNYNYFSM